AKDIPPVLDIESCLDFVRPRLQRCGLSHVLCKPNPHISDYPARFLVIDSKAPLPILRLVDQKEVKSPYIALSHCWGNKEGIIETTRAGLINVTHTHTHLPKSFRDTAFIAQALDIHHLWIDSLCIIQDDEQDWAQESVKMADVYSAAILTIAITGSVNPSGGCLFPRRQHLDKVDDPVLCTGIASRVERLNLPPEVRMRYERVCHQRMEGQHTSWEEVDTQISPLLTRAWAFQEKILSPRMIHFHGEEMIWECNEEHACECGYEPLGGHDPTRTSSIVARAVESGRREEIWQLWADLVVKYILLDITFEKDRLPALAGLGKYLSRILDCTYMAGLWKEDFGRQLLWNRDYLGRNPSPSHRAQQVPTWTWASV
ncbi:heterokaryon incompatibility protein-domain-containing protein, partial [Cercophora samala]